MAQTFPSLGIDPRLAALIGMSALFAGASRAVLTSVVFAFKTTLQPVGLLPLLGSCSAAYFISSALMKSTIMTEKIVRRGIKVSTDFSADYLDRTLVCEIYSPGCKTLRSSSTLAETRHWVASGERGSQHQGYPVVNEDDILVGVLTHRDLLDLTAAPETRLGELIKRAAVCVYPDQTIREAADLMVQEEVGRLPVVARQDPQNVLGILSRSDVLSIHRDRLNDHHERGRSISLSLWKKR